MDYDTSEIAMTYDRAREHPPEVLSEWMKLTARSIRVPPAKIVDLGCGTGRFSYALATHFQADVVGIDPSRQMLARARARAKAANHSGEGVRFELALADAIPLSRGSADLIFMSQVFHHLENPGVVACRCHDVLVDSSAVLVRNATVENIPSIRYVDFFPESGPLLRERVPSRQTVQVAFESAGFRLLLQGSLPSMRRSCRCGRIRSLLASAIRSSSRAWPISASMPKGRNGARRSSRRSISSCLLSLLVGESRSSSAEAP